MELSKRLREVVSWIDTDILADIGCDHAYLCTEAIQKKKAQKAYACDIAQGPLEQAKHTIEQAGLQNQIFPVLSNGMEKVPEDAHQIVICGMGAKTMTEILEAALEKDQFRSVVSLLLSPHKDASELRSWLQKHHFFIVREKIVFEGHYYPVLEVIPDKLQTLDFAEILYGVNVEPGKAAQDYLEKEITVWSSRLHQLPENKRLEAEKKIEAAKMLLLKIKKPASH